MRRQTDAGVVAIGGISDGIGRVLRGRIICGVFEMYCDEVGIAKELRRDIYYQLAEKAEKKFKQRQVKQGY